MRKEKILTLLVISLFAFSFVAANNYDVNVPAGDTVESDVVSVDEVPSTLLGGIVSALSNTLINFVDYNGVNIWETSETTLSEFVLQIWPANTVVNDNVDMGDLFESSELVSIRGTTPHVFETYDVSYSVSEEQDDNFQEPVIYLGVGTTDIFFEDGDKVSIGGYSWDSSSSAADVFWTVAGGVQEGQGNYPITACTELNCPSIAVLESVFGFEIKSMNLVIAPLPVPKKVLLISGISPTAKNIWMVGDWDGDGEWEFGTIITSSGEGWQTTSFEQQSLALIEAQTVDIYAEVI